MKRLPLQIAAVLGMLGALCLVPPLSGQGKIPAARGASVPSTKFAVVDMNYVFQHYEKFEDLRLHVNEAAEAAQTDARKCVDAARMIEEQLKSGEFEDGSPEFLERETKVIQLSSRFEMLKASTKKDLKKKETQVLIAVYEDVRHALELFAEQNGYTLIMQINRAVAASDDKSKVAQMIGQNVFLNRGADDISEAVLEYLSQAYAAEKAEQPEKTGPAKAAPPTAAPSRSREPARSAAASPRTKTTRK